MSLIDRLAGIPPEGQSADQARKLGVNTFHAALYELAAGQVTRSQLVSYFMLDGGEAAELDWVIAQYNAQPNAAAKARYVELLRVVFVLAESRVPGYSTRAELAERLTV